MDQNKVHKKSRDENLQECYPSSEQWERKDNMTIYTPYLRHIYIIFYVLFSTMFPK